MTDRRQRRMAGKWAMVASALACCLFALSACSIVAGGGTEATEATSEQMPIVSETGAFDTSSGQGSAAQGTQATSTPQPAATEPVTINLLAAGDVVVHSPVYNSGLQEDGSFAFDHLFAQVAQEASAADVALISQETPLGGEELGLSGYPCFNGPYQIGDAEVAAGFDVMVKASNHVLDRGSAGIANELAFWRENHPEIAVVGMADSQEAYDNIYVYEKDGFKVALLNYTYDTNGIPFPEDNPWATHLFDDEEIAADVERARSLADLVVVWPHWGTEYQSDPDDFQLYYAQYFCDLGVDLVIGSHPHTICPVDVLENESGHRTLVFYSLGNFLSNQIEGVMTSVGAMVQVRLVKDASGARVTDWTFEPTVTQRGNGADFATWPLHMYTDELAAANFTPLTRQECEDFCSSVLGPAFNPESSTMSGSM